eukprot:6210780-Pleurochrysis_carterae.AAC.1
MMLLPPQVVDAHNIMRQLESLEACRQIGSADVILLNKIDGCSESHLQSIRSVLTQLNAAAPVITTCHSAAPLDKLFHLNAYAASGGRVLEPALPPAKTNMAWLEFTPSGKKMPFAKLCECCAEKPRDPIETLQPQVETADKLASSPEVRSSSTNGGQAPSQTDGGKQADASVG